MSDLNLAFEPAWPWSIPHVGLPAMLGVALLLAAMTIWTYTGVRKATWRRVGVVLLLRLAALLLTFLALLRPSFGVTHLEGVDTSKLLVVFDQSESMTVADMADGAKRWEHVKRLWESRAVKSRLEQLAAEQKIEVVPYLGAEDLRPYEPNAVADGKRTDIGAWLNQLWQRHGHEKYLRGIVLFSDGADNGTRFSVQQEAGRWRGVCPITAFGAGNPNDPKFRKDIALTGIDVEPNPVPVKAKMTIRAKAIAPGFDKTPVHLVVTIEDVATKKTMNVENLPSPSLGGEKEQAIIVNTQAPDKSGEYKLTLRITPHPDEANPDNNEISTYVQVIKEKIKILWVDRPRVYEPIAAIRAIKTDPRFAVYYAEKPVQPKDLDDGLYDVLVIGDISAKRFSGGDNAVFSKIAERVQTNHMGLLMLGGEETFGNGGWQAHPELMALLPVDFAEAGFLDGEVRVRSVKGKEDLPFLQLSPDPKENTKYWKKMDPLDGLAMMGKVRGDLLMEGDKGQPVMAAHARGGRVAVFAGDSTAKAWLTPETVVAYDRFWKRLALWMANQTDDGKLLWIRLDKRRVNARIGEALGFTFGLKDKKGNDLRDATFPVLKVIGPKQQEFALTPIRDKDVPYQRGVFQGAKEPGEYKIVITGLAPELDAPEKVEASFLVVSDNIEMLRPVAEHETLRKLAAASGGRFFAVEEAALLAYLDDLKSQVNSESRHKTTQWPDWNRLPASDHTRDQLAGLWHSFALGGFLLFTALLGGEWLLRRMWGLV
jgi:hypothetical protein